MADRGLKISEAPVLPAAEFLLENEAKKVYLPVAIPSGKNKGSYKVLLSKVEGITIFDPTPDIEYLKERVNELATQPSAYKSLVLLVAKVGMHGTLAGNKIEHINNKMQITAFKTFFYDEKGTLALCIRLSNEDIYEYITLSVNDIDRIEEILKNYSLKSDVEKLEVIIAAEKVARQEADEALAAKILKMSGGGGTNIVMNDKYQWEDLNLKFEWGT